MELLSWIFFGPAKLIALLSYAGFLVGGTLLAGQAIQTLRLRGCHHTNLVRFDGSGHVCPDSPERRGWRERITFPLLAPNRFMYRLGRLG